MQLIVSLSLLFITSGALTLNRFVLFYLGGGGAKTEGERETQAGSMPSTELDEGLSLTTMRS